jgi:YbbR domain-containing protein
MKAVLRWTASNLPLAVLALILATVVWAIAAEEADPVRTERYFQAIPLKTVGRPEGVFIVGGLTERVYVTVRAPESVWDDLVLDDFEAFVDLANIEPGVHELPVEVVIDKQPAEVLSVEPQYVTLELQPWVERAMPVRVQVEGEPALAYLAGSPIMTPTHVIVGGPSSYIDQVVEVNAQISADGASADVDGEVSLQALDVDGQSVPLVTLVPEAAHVRVPVELREDYKTLAVKPVREGLVAYGYTITGFSVDPDTVTVSGAPEIVAALPGFIETETVSVEGARDNVIAHPLLSLPQNVVLLPGQQVTVTFFVEAIQSSLTIEITPTLEGLSPGLTATVSPGTIEVFLSGPLPELEAIGEGDVRLVVDLFELEPGMHQVVPQVIVPTAVTGYSVLPATVQVEILVGPTAVPTPRPTPTPSPTPGGS